MWYTTQNTRQTKKCLVTKGSQTEPNNLKENTMSQFEKQFQEFEAQVKKISDFWIDAIITSLKALQK